MTLRNHVQITSVVPNCHEASELGNLTTSISTSLLVPLKPNLPGIPDQNMDNTIPIQLPCEIPEKRIRIGTEGGLDDTRAGLVYAPSSEKVIWQMVTWFSPPLIEH